MNQKSTTPPIACQRLAGVFSPEVEKRHREIWKEMEGNIQGVEELESGYAFRFPLEDAMFQKLAEYITYERHCCPFFHFTLEMVPGEELVKLGLTGGEGVKDFLTSEIASNENPIE